ncbi:hypothetical protein T492DRAFT_1010112 [Pavlovales sp. CCMP2436]|nr:hypothetical protein T492DRAFT_1010112 [Pavlovales sp. CCMP2436]
MAASFMSKLLLLAGALAGAQAFAPEGVPALCTSVLTRRADLRARPPQSRPSFPSALSQSRAATRRADPRAGPPRLSFPSTDLGSPSMQPLGLANAAVAVAWVGLVAFANAFSPGEFGSTADAGLVTTLIANPTSPMDAGLSPVFALIFNLFLPVPLMLAALLLPTSREQRVPALPFVGASLALGFFTLGPYLALRGAPQPLDADGKAPPFGFFDTRAFGVLVFALVCSIPVSAQVFQVNDWSSAVADFLQLLESSKLVSVSCADLSVLSVTLACLVREDSCRRDFGNPNALCAISLLLPAFAPAVYFLLRPRGPTSE